MICKTNFPLDAVGAMSDVKCERGWELQIYKSANHIHIPHSWSVSVLESGQLPSSDDKQSEPRASYWTRIGIPTENLNGIQINRSQSRRRIYQRFEEREGNGKGTAEISTYTRLPSAKHCFWCPFIWFVHWSWFLSQGWPKFSLSFLKPLINSSSTLSGTFPSNKRSSECPDAFTCCAWWSCAIHIDIFPCWYVWESCSFRFLPLLFLDRSLCKLAIIRSHATGEESRRWQTGIQIRLHSFQWQFF